MKLLTYLCFFTIGVCCKADHFQIEIKNSNEHGIPKGELMIQRVTSRGHHPNNLYYCDDNKKLIWVDESTQCDDCWDYNTGHKSTHYIKELDGETIIFDIPFKSDKNKRVIGSDGKVRILTYKNDNYTITKPIAKLKNPNCKFTKAHCDKNGNLLALTHLKTKMPTNSRLYHIYQNGTLKLIHKFKKGATDFTWSSDFKKIYFVENSGECITSYNYNENNSSISNHTEILKMKHHPGVIKSIEIDTNNCIWITVESSVGRLMRVNIEKKEIEKIIALPIQAPSSMTFGGDKHMDLFISSIKNSICHNRASQDGSIWGVSGFNHSGSPDIGANFK